MRIAGIMKSSFIDFPGKAAAVIFTAGCNFRCGYCHNPEIVRCVNGDIAAEDVLDFLEKRKRFLDALCISGGEPTLQEDLADFAARVKELGYLIKLDTNGSHPQALRELLQRRLVDYVAMDIKAPFEAYDRVTGTGAFTRAVKESKALLEAGGTQYEFRTTVCRELLSFRDLELMAGELAGSPKWFLQSFKKQGELLDENGCYSAYEPEEMQEFAEKIQQIQGERPQCVSVR